MMAATELLIPVQRYTSQSGIFRFPDTTLLASPTQADLLPLGQLSADLKAQNIATKTLRNAFGAATLRIIRSKVLPQGAPAGTQEAYKLEISPTLITITASGDAGAYYAVQTLRELMTVQGRELACCTIEDWPDFARRAVYEDCARGKVPKVATVKDLILQLAAWKINELQLYIENTFAFSQHPEIGKGFSPFTAEELLDIRDFAKQHHVKMVGSLASFGHLEKILCLKPYRHLDEMYGIQEASGSTLCPGDPKSIEFIASLFDEFLPLYEAEDFNVCCDETWELGKGRSKEATEKLGIGRVYADFLKQIHALCEKHGKRMNAWADIVLEHPEMLGELPKDIVMLNWDYDPAGVRIPRTNEIAEAGMPLGVCPGTNSWASHGCRLAMGMANIAIFAKEGRKYHAEQLLNTDWGDGGHRNMLAVSLHNLAYGAAHSWCGEKTEDAGFTERFVRHTFGGEFTTLPADIITLGNANANTDQSWGNWVGLYFLLLGPLSGFVTNEWIAEALPNASKENFLKHRTALQATKWPSPAQAKNAFMARSFEEYALATQLDTVACLRAAVLMDLRAHQSPDQNEVKTLINETEALLANVARVWKIGNKQSRLADITKGLKQSVGEYRKMVG
jgi:hexosaminidase